LRFRQWDHRTKGGRTRQAGPAPKLQQQMERIRRLRRAKQRFGMDMIDTVLAQQDR